MTGAHLDLDGELTIVTAAETLGRLKPYLESGAAVEVDLSGVVDIDTAGLQLLLLAQQESDRRGAAITFHQPSPVVREMLSFTRLTDELERP